jgi:hypothetical protein
LIPRRIAWRIPSRWRRIVCASVTNEARRLRVALEMKRSIRTATSSTVSDGAKMPRRASLRV